MKIFISWSGEKSRSAAEALRDWLPNVLQEAKPWISSSDLNPGAHWFQKLQGQLDQSKFCIICVTKENVNAPWIHYEAGASANLVENRTVCPLLIDMPKKDLSLSPLSQYQAITTGTEDIYSLILTLNSKLNNSLPEERLRRAFLKWWPEIRGKLAGLSDEGTGRHAWPELSLRGKLRAGAILYANVVKYSTLSTHEQDYGAEHLLEWSSRLPVENQTESYLDHRYWVKFGGGDLLIYAQNNNDLERDCVVLKRTFFFALDLLEFIAAKNFQLGITAKDFQLGITLHWADGCNYQTCDSLVELWGNELDRVRRLMSFSDGGHFFISDSAFNRLNRDLFRGARMSGESIRGSFLPIVQEGKREVENILKSSSLSSAGEDREFNLDPLQVYDRYYFRHKLFNFYVDNAEREVSLGNSSRPPDYVKIEHRDKRDPTDRNQCFVKHLVESDRVCIVALTHEKTRDYLDTALKERNKREEGKVNFWERLDIIFPNEKFLNQWVEEDKDWKTRRRRWEEGKRTVLQFLEATASEYAMQWNCWETESNLTFWGNRLLKGDMEILRLAPLLPGPDLKDLRYVTFHKGIDGYHECSEALDIMLAGSMSIAEWDLIGRCSNSRQFTYAGIAKRSYLKHLNGSFCMPVVLVILYMDDALKGLQLLLQKRSIFNATDQHGKFSNISGRVCIADTSDDPQQTAQYYMAISHKSQGCKDPGGEADLATQAFNIESGWKKGMVLDNAVWERAVVREIREELGLEFQDRSRIEYLRDYHLLDSINKLNLYFKIHALQITREELDKIRSRRTRCDLRETKMETLDQYFTDGELNHFLQQHYHDVFKPIFKDTLRIEER